MSPDLGFSPSPERLYLNLRSRIKKRIYADKEMAILDLVDYIDHFYNSVRRHSYLGGVSPNQFEAAHRNAQITCLLNPGDSIYVTKTIVVQTIKIPMTFAFRLPC